jgi:hypothetical protein
LLDQGRPQTPNLVDILNGRLDHDQFRGRIDADALAVGADERELAPVSRNSYSRTSAWLWPGAR